jgi:O-antigen/teichoic acid export membrane protein
LSKVRVRRSGLVSFVVKLGSLLTGLVFTVIVTTHLSGDEFGLWSLIGKTLGYTLLPTSILAFWTTRYRARGIFLGKTIAVGSAIFSIILTGIFLAISIPIAGTIHGQVSSSPNLFYFILSSPQIALYTFAGSFEALLWATSPERNSIGFASFEIAKVAIGFYTIAILHLSLTGSIVTVVLAQAFQLGFTAFMTRNEFKDKVSLGTFSRMVKTGWLAILNNLHNLIRSFDFLVIAAFTGSLNLLAYFAAALVISAITGYSTFLGQGLYPSVLAGADPKTATKQVLELQLLFLFPMVLGGIFLRMQLLNLLNPFYISASGILIVLAVGSGFDSLQSLFESSISASDRTDAVEKVNLGIYLQSRLFLLSRINLSLAGAYLGSLVVIGAVFGPQILSNPSSTGLLLNLGLIWASVNASISFLALMMKIYYHRRFAPFSLDSEMIRALVVGSAVFSILMYFIGVNYHPPQKEEIVQALNILGIGVLGFGSYGAVVYALSKTVRGLVRAIIHNLVSLPAGLAGTAHE